MTVRKHSIKRSESASDPACGQRVFTCGHSFHAWVADILADMAGAAGIRGHRTIGVSFIGGSRVMQHWDVPAEQNEAKKALRAGSVDVLTLSPIWLPDEGIGKVRGTGDGTSSERSCHGSGVLAAERYL